MFTTAGPCQARDHYPKRDLKINGRIQRLPSLRKDFPGPDVRRLSLISPNTAGVSRQPGPLVLGRNQMLLASTSPPPPDRARVTAARSLQRRGDLARRFFDKTEITP
jgi:hypothetical protein